MDNLKKPSVLVVDDDCMMRELLKIILQSEKYVIIGEATNGEQAVKMCARLKPDLVLLDIAMPKMDGLQALEEIHWASPTSKVLMVSADSTMGKVSEALEKGAAGFIVKPLNPASVLNRVEQCLKK
ncbi:response regulator [Sulfuriferula thiophila]|uniref:response regulator n=1 Tax=Sulfuriferula thiophila TaxID=1781211 RepID=UPI000F604D83|nr:response regulator [Sulfuriferula thiophila]